MKCGAAIILCNGFQLARDTLAAMNGEIEWKKVREHCGKCVEIIEHDGREAYFATIK
jgi:hypothetical protein